MDLFNEAKQHLETMMKHRRFLHRHPEIHHALPITTRYVQETLESIGVEVTECASSGLVGIIGNPNLGRTLLLRADMDALPIKEETLLPYTSESDNMHACGHDLHTAMLLGAAALLKAHEAELKGAIKLMFQPAEETLSGAKAMIEAGVMNHPSVDAAMMMHVFSLAEIPSGNILILTDGAASASCDAFTIHIKGQGGHGAMPHGAIDPLVAMSHIHLALQTIHAREISPDEFLVITPCTLKGGHSFNIIPDTACMQGTIRTFNEDVRTYAKKRLKDIAIMTGQAHQCSVEVVFEKSCPSVQNHPTMNRFVKDTAESLFSQTHVIEASALDAFKHGRMTGSEDFSFVSELVPSAMIFLSAGSPDENNVFYAMHHPKVRFDDSVLPIGAALFAQTAFNWLKNS